MNKDIKLIYKCMMYIRDEYGLDESGVVQYIEEIEFDWYPPEDIPVFGRFTSPVSEFIRKYRVEQNIRLER